MPTTNTNPRMAMVKNIYDECANKTIKAITIFLVEQKK